MWLVEGSLKHMAEVDQAFQRRFPSPNSRSLKETDHIGVHAEQRIRTVNLKFTVLLIARKSKEPANLVSWITDT